MNLYQDEAVMKWMRAMPQTFVEWIEQEIDDGLRGLMSSADLLNVGRYQGAIQVLRNLQQFKKEA